ncbi:MAG: hypothetical protein PHO02_00690 [Candidatus Nanoarchaeia archaeon]|nr:hypothetical protein [Candidatus Nanoarchaeia archaeon]
MNKILLILIASFVVLVSGCTTTKTEVENQQDMQATQVSEIQEEKINPEEILVIRQNYDIEVNNWEKTQCFTDSYTSDLKLDLKITNNNVDKKLDYLTIRVNQYDSSGELVGWGRTSVKVSVLEPQTSDYALPCIKGAIPSTIKVEVEIEKQPSEDSYKFFKELQ